MAVWPSGKAGDCKSSIPSSNLGAAYGVLLYYWFIIISFGIVIIYILVGVVELVDTTDLKSVAERCDSSSLFSRTNSYNRFIVYYNYLLNFFSNIKCMIFFILNVRMCYKLEKFKFKIEDCPCCITTNINPSYMFNYPNLWISYVTN